ncbi:Ubiquitin and WLM domain-containing metalloprotease [Porphyridium purpureum]|uniref:Ubiquitin and WLM domain-containing metalloprotease n=1 Tax=Porphyridium purpureum TaxID=35688 RepID=A0A5J4Z0M8_PORPP|nr:Ubiquitin and WLM domain-containing metalloprotease [Porphyridium purpureum]|eukprot:POR7830..scf208_2
MGPLSDAPQGAVNIHVSSKEGTVTVRCAAPSGMLVKDLQERIQDQMGVEADLQKLIYRGRMLHQEELLMGCLGLDAAAHEQSVKLMLIASSRENVNVVQALREDKLLKGFRKPAASKYAARPRKLVAPLMSPYGFANIQALPEFEDHHKALDLLNKLAHDPGISRIMDSRQWQVGALKEMKPEGKVGVDPVCVLGFNVSAGTEIHLRLRTDDMLGFRPYWKLIEVLCHELAHNVHQEHDKNFYALMNQLLKEQKAGDWKQSTARSMDRTSAYLESKDASGFDDWEEPDGRPDTSSFEGKTAVLGTSNEGNRISYHDARESAIQAAQERVLSSSKSARRQNASESFKSKGTRAVQESGAKLNQRGPDVDEEQVGSDAAACRMDIAVTSEMPASQQAFANDARHRLVAMGFQESIVDTAVSEFGGDFDRSLEFVMAVEVDNQTISAQSGTLAEVAEGADAEDHVDRSDDPRKQLVLMGFCEKEVDVVLEECHGDFFHSLEVLVARDEATSSSAGVSFEGNPDSLRDEKMLSRDRDIALGAADGSDTAAHMQETTQEYVAKANKLVAELVDEIRSSGGHEVSLQLALDTLRTYFSNALRHPGELKFCRINSQNATFQARLGRYKHTPAVLRGAGFELDAQGYWMLRRHDPALLYIFVDAADST